MSFALTRRKKSMTPMMGCGSPRCTSQVHHQIEKGADCLSVWKQLGPQTRLRGGRRLWGSKRFPIDRRNSRRKVGLPRRFFKQPRHRHFPPIPVSLTWLDVVEILSCSDQVDCPCGRRHRLRSLRWPRREGPCLRSVRGLHVGLNHPSSSDAIPRLISLQLGPRGKTRRINN